MFKNIVNLRNISRTSNGLLQRGNRQYSNEPKLVDVQVNNEGYAVVTMQRPPVNGLNLDLISELLSTLLSLDKNKSRGMILTSASSSVFSAGLDIMEMYKPDKERLKKFWTALQDLWLHLYSSSYPTVAVINGHSPAGGCLLACSCEYRIMLKGNYTIGLNETQLGIVAPFWFIDTFKGVLPCRTAEAALIEGKLFPVEEALKVGLIDQVVDSKENGIEEAYKFLNKFKRISPPARAQTKFAVRYEAIKRLQDGRDQDLKTFSNFVQNPEVQKGLELYMQELKKRGKS